MPVNVGQYLLIRNCAGDWFAVGVNEDRWRSDLVAADAFKGCDSLDRVADGASDALFIERPRELGASCERA